MPFYITLMAYLSVGILIACFIRVDIVDNNRKDRRIAQLEAELAFSKRQVGTMRHNSVQVFNDRHLPAKMDAAA